MRSLDNGETWSAPVVLSGLRSSGARAAVGPDGEVYVTWLDHQQASVVGRKSVDDGATFGPEFVVGLIRDNPGTWPPGWVGAENLEYNHPWFTECLPADRPSLAIDHTNGPRRGTLYITWTERALGDVQPIIATIPEQEPNDSHVTANPIMIGQAVSGRIPSADLGGNDPGDHFAFDGTAGTTIVISGTLSSSQPPSLLVYRFDGLVGGTEVQPIDRCNFLGTGYAVAPFIFTLPADGRYVVWTGGSGQADLAYTLAVQELVVTPGQAARDHRDVVLVSSSDGGATWSPRVRVNDDPPRFDNALPAVAVDARGRVHVSWYDRRHATDPGATSVDTYWTWSEDGGQTFAASQRLSTQTSDYGAFGEQWRIGTYQSLEPVGDQVYAVWSQMVGLEDADIFGARIDPDTVTAVLVSGLSGAVLAPTRVVLRWHLASAQGVVGLRVHRAEGDGPMRPAAGGEVQVRVGAGNYEWEDPAVLSGHTYRYQLEVLTEAGSVWEGPIEVEVPIIAASLHWARTQPNPFGDHVDLELEVPRGGMGTVDVYDVSGKRVVRLHRGTLGTGVTHLSWDGTDGRGQPVRAGLYLIQARSGSDVATLRLLRVR